LDQIAAVGVNLSGYIKLFGREIIFEVFQRVKNIPERHGQTDGQADGQTTYCGIESFYFNFLVS